MQYELKLVFGLWLRKNQSTHFVSVHAAIRCYEVFTKDLADVRKRGSAYACQLPRNGVSIYKGKTSVDQQAGKSGFTAANTAGESNTFESSLLHACSL